MRTAMRLMCMFTVLLGTLSAFSQSSSKYQVGTITAVKQHQAAADDGADAVSYDISVKVGDITYVVLYAPPMGAAPIKYAAGRNVLVLVGEKTIRYNNIAGESREVPIISRKSGTETNQSKPASESASAN